MKPSLVNFLNKIWKILKKCSFAATPATKGGENYASNLMRVKMVVTLGEC